MIIREKTLRQIVSEAMGHRDVDIMVLKACSKARERGYMVKGHLNSMLTIGGLAPEIYHLADPKRWGEDGALPKSDRNENVIRLLEAREAIEKNLDYSSRNTTIGDLAQAIHELSDFLEGAYTMVRLSRYLQPGRNIYFETCAWNLIRCYEHTARAYLRLLSTEDKEGSSK